MSKSREDGLIFGAVIGLVAVVVLNVLAGSSYLRAATQLTHTGEVRRAVDGWVIGVLAVELAVRDAIDAPDAATNAAVDPAFATEREKAALMASLVGGSPSEQRAAKAIGARADAVIAALHEEIALARAGRREEALARVSRGDDRRLVEAFRATARDARAGVEEDIAGQRETRSQRLTLWFGAGVLAALSISLAGMAWNGQRRRVRMLDRVAEEARRRLEALSEIAAALAEERSRARVAEVVVDRGMAVLGADTCALHLMNDDGTALELEEARGIATDLLPAIQRMTATSGNTPAFEAMLAGTTIWAEDEAAYVAAFPDVANAKASGRRAKAFWMIPLVVEGRPVGLLAMGYYAARAFPREERAFIETFAKQSGQALVRAAHMQREDEARQWFETTLASIGDAVIATDERGHVRYMNAVAERMTAWTDEDARGRPLEDVFCIFSERTREPVQNPVAKALAEGRAVGLANHTILRSKKGDEMSIDDSAAPIRDREGRLFGVVLVFRDLSDEKRRHVREEFLARAGEALVASLDYRTTLTTLTQLAVPEIADWCAIDIVENEGELPKRLALAHVDPAKVVEAQELADRYPPNPKETVGLVAVLRTGKAELYPSLDPALVEASGRDDEHRRLLRDLRLESAIIVPLRAQDRIFGAITFVYAGSGRHYAETDLTFAEDFGRRAAMAIENAFAMRQVEESRAREGHLRSEAEMANRAKDEFLATVSHELRNPLNAILGWAVTLRERGLPADLDRPLGVIERNARAQAKLIEDVLDVSRIISGKLALTMRATDVADTISAAVETVTPAATTKGLRIVVDAPRDVLLVSADGDRLQQVVWNLLTNAVKFTPRGGEIRVSARRAGPEAQILVTDTGEGISAEVLPRVFERFHQADATTTRRHGGLGLGLAIVRHIVSAHGGTVTASSDGLGKGSTFVVALPATKPASPAAATGSVPPRAGASRLAGLRVLIVDDEPDVRSLVAEVLRGQGAEVQVAESAAEALESVQKSVPDVLVSDIGMPLMDGYALIRAIRALPAENAARLPALALSAYARIEDAQKALAAGFQKHVTKPVEPGTLVGLVASLVGRD